MLLGIDIGSVSVKIILFQINRKEIKKYYLRHYGQPIPTVINSLREILSEQPINSFEYIGITGAGGKLIAEILQIPFVNEIVAQAKATAHLYPQVKTIIEIGGEDSKLILLDRETIKDFSMNTLCAAGTGSFLDQQASRLGISIDKFGKLALLSQNPSCIAGRCSVFAKSDMIHLQQKATPECDIIAGLCFAMARNFKSTLGKGKDFIPQISFQGGVAANQGMVRIFEKVLNLKEDEFLIPQHHAHMGAIGAALIAQDKKEPHNFEGIKALEEYLKKPNKKSNKRALLSLEKVTQNNISKSLITSSISKKNGKIDAFLGIDVGSISTNLVVLDKQKNILARHYLWTGGRPIEAVRRGLLEIGEELGSLINIKGICTTGSGRYIIGDFVGADLIKNEITAQAKAAVEIDKSVDTIFEIGGQDSKYISLENGTIVDFEMNKVCAAGTGSFLEEQSEKLGIKIEEFGSLALSSSSPTCLGERCTVFMGSDLSSQQSSGALKEDLLAGLAYSIVYNYLNLVVDHKRIGNNIFFQGGVAHNKAIVSAFQQILKKKITVPSNHDVTGAIGCALLSMEQTKSNEKLSKFKGFDLSKKSYNVKSFECKGCSNTCQINLVRVEGEKVLYYGGICGKYEADRKYIKNDIEPCKSNTPCLSEDRTSDISCAGSNDIPDFFDEREKLLLGSYKAQVENGGSPKRFKIGMPRTLLFYELFPFFNAYFTALDFEIILSEPTNKNIIHLSCETAPAETCFPVKVVSGHVLDLFAKRVDYIFLPSLINSERINPRIKENYYCPYVQTIPYIISPTMPRSKTGPTLLRPILKFQLGEKEVEKVLVKFGQSLGKTAKQSKRAIKSAFTAQKMFHETTEKKGGEILSALKNDQKAIIIIGRPYNTCDKGLNLNIAKKLRELGTFPLPMDFLPLDSIDLGDEWSNMYWRFGQKLLCAAKFIHRSKNIYPVYITNFGCGPDSFLSSFFRRQLNGKPYLQIEIDEHSADVGVITRLEAFLDSLQ